MGDVARSPGPTVAVAGLGRMGSAMAARLADAAMLTAVYNRTGAIARAEADRLGVKACETAGDLARAAEILITIVSDDQAVDDVYSGERGILAAIEPGTLCVEMSTIAPATVRAVAARLAERGCGLLDAPVSGSTEMAGSGALTVLVGGDPDLVDRARPVFDQLGERIHHVGPSGSGAALKLAVNNIVYGLNQSVAESLVLAEHAGIDRRTAYEVFANGAAAAPFVEYRRALFERPDTEDVQMDMRLAAKDLALIEALAEDVGAAVPQAALNRELLHEAIDAGHGDRDVTAVAEHLRQRPADR